MRAWAHPRVCGENSVAQRSAACRKGSSPRVRGKRRITGLHDRRAGLIPACAGKTVGGFRPALLAGAHPRVCGENAAPQPAPGPIAGSSPRVRGKLEEVSGSFAVGGLIPACAGKTANHAEYGTCTPAHPRVCGENMPTQSAGAFGSGSSPRVRGKLSLLPTGRRLVRLIPACAGKTLSVRTRSRKATAHPRVCGENLASGETWPLGVGSSPRVRGKPGEVLAANNFTGSSPRVRGKLVVCRRSPRPEGLIPACAGKTSGFGSAGPSPKAHPRVCGENRIGVTQPAVAEGSSPRVRGKH